MNMIREYTTTDFALFPETLTPTEAIAQLKENCYGVVVDENNKPKALVVAEDLERAANRGTSSLLHPESGLPPTVLVGCQVSMEDLVRPETKTLFKVGARGAIALDDGGIVIGVLPVEAVDTYLHSAHSERTIADLAPSSSGGDTGLPGSLQLPDGIIICAECGYSNNVPFLDPEYLPRCKNLNKPPHILKLPK